MIHDTQPHAAEPPPRTHPLSLSESPAVRFRQKADFVFEHIDAGIAEWTGIPQPDWIGVPGRFWEVLHEDDRAAMEERLRAGKPLDSESWHVFRIRHALTGRILHVAEQRQVIRDTSGALQGFAGIWVNQTPKIQAEQRLASAHWKEVIARLSVGFVHDLNNAFAGVSSLSELCLMEMEPDHPLHQNLTYIKDSTRKAIDLVEKLSTLLREKKDPPVYINLNEMARQLIGLVRPTIPRRIELETNWSESALPVYAGEQGLRKSLLSLILNAADAIPHQGRITLQTSQHETLPDGVEWLGKKSSLPAICLSVSDTGIGLAYAKAADLGNLYYSSKPNHAGIGIGLSEALHFAESNRGGISFSKNNATSGATFQIWLPRADFTEAETFASPSSPKSPLKVLVTGTNTDLAQSVIRPLEANGLRVVKVREGATERLTNDEETFDGVIIAWGAAPSDASLPPLAARIRGLLPIMKIIVIRPITSQSPTASPFTESPGGLLDIGRNEANWVARVVEFLRQSDLPAD